MRLYIPTAGRANRQVTWKTIPANWRGRTLLVVQEREEHQYREYPHVTLPYGIVTIAATRDWIMANATDEKIIMMDDDLQFSCRRTDMQHLLRPAEPEDMDGMLHGMEKVLDTYVHAGIAPREGANRCTDTFMYNTRITRFVGYRTDVVRKLGLKYEPLVFMSDFHMTLQLLEAGYQNIMLNQWAQNQTGGSNAPGGCSTYRTKENLAESAYRLAELHPEFVTPVEKETKSAWGGGTRIDVRVQWKKALGSKVKS